MHFHPGSSVRDQRRNPLGKLTHFVLTPQLHEVSLLVVKPPRARRVLRLEQVVSASDQEVVVRPTPGEWEKLPRYHPGKVTSNPVPEASQPPGAPTGTIIIELEGDILPWEARMLDQHVSRETEVYAGRWPAGRGR